MPSRLVVACQHPSDSADEDSQPGHIDDFPWVWWAFSQQQSPCPAPQLKLESTGETAGFAGLVARCYCERCRGKVGRSLEGVFRNEALQRLRCYARRPWLDDESPEGCARRVRALLRGASNVYFPVTVSAISIPPFSRSLFQLIQACVIFVGLTELDSAPARRHLYVGASRARTVLRILLPGSCSDQVQIKLTEVLSALAGRSTAPRPSLF